MAPLTEDPSMSTPSPGPPSEEPPPRFQQASDIKKHLPLHYYVWHNDAAALKSALRSDDDRSKLESKDAHGRTPLMLAAVLGRREVARLLLDHGASVRAKDDTGFTALHEALSNPGDVSSKKTPDFRLLRRFYRYHSKEEMNELAHYAIKTLAPKLAKITDFYFEIHWDFSSRVPFIANTLPKETVRVYKSGNRVRIDTTLLDINMSGLLPKFESGNVSYVITCKGDSVDILNVDHEEKSYARKTLNKKGDNEGNGVSSEEIFNYLKEPIHIYKVDMSKLSVKPIKEGWINKKDKTELIDNLECAVYKIKGITMHCRARRNHLSKSNKNDKPSPTELKYFTGAKDAGAKRKIVHSKEEISVDAWMTTDQAFPLSISQHVMPILDLMSLYSGEFDRQRTRLLTGVAFPSGFPLQLEVPVIPFVLKAKVKFGNVYALVTPVEGVSEFEGKCEIQDRVFEVPQGYAIDTDQ